MKQETKTILRNVAAAVGVVIFIAVVWVAWMIFNLPGVHDHDEARLLAKSISSELKMSENKKILYRPHPRKIKLYVYGVISVAEQEEIIRQVKKNHRDYSEKPIHITFYSSDAFVTTSAEPGKTTEKRIDQDALRVENIE